MDVTTENFEEVFPAIEKAIQSCDFMSMDFELTGLFTRSGPSPTAVDTIQQRYEMSGKAAETFLPIQFGLCTVAWNGEKERYEANTFNFYIHPHVPKNGYTFVSDLSSLKFLSSNNFDFNKLFAHGIPFISQEKQKWIEEQNAKRQEERTPISLTPEDETYLNNALDKVKEWLQTVEPSMELPPCNSYLIRILFQEIPARYPNLSLSQVSVDGQRWKSMKFERLSPEVIAENKKAEEEKEKARIQEAAGFRKVIDVMCNAKKPLMGHNMFLDACYFYNYFLGPLPQDVNDFKKNLLSKFPLIIDTKFMAGQTDSLSTALSDMYDELSKVEKPEITFVEGDSDGQAHNAGWDAYMTANIFVKLCSKLDSTEEHPIKFTENSPLRNFWNIINITRLTSNLELDNDQQHEKAPDNIFHVHDFEPQVRTSDIISWFSEFGRVHVNWKDDNSAFVTIHDEEKLPQVIEFTKRPHEKFEVESVNALRDRTKKEPSTPPQVPLDAPPPRTRRTSLKGTGKRPRPASIGFDSPEAASIRKKSRKNSEPQKTFECCIC